MEELSSGVWALVHCPCPCPCPSEWSYTRAHRGSANWTPWGREGRRGDKVGRGMLWNLEGVSVGECGLDMIKLLCTVHEILKEQTQSILKNGASITAS